MMLYNLYWVPVEVFVYSIVSSAFTPDNVLMCTFKSGIDGIDGIVPLGSRAGASTLF